MRELLRWKRFKKEKEELTKLLHQEEAFWKQRSKVHQLKEGDMKTKFFHSSTTSRKKKQIKYQEDEEGRRVEDQEGICKLTLDYFASLFASVGGHYAILETKLLAEFQMMTITGLRDCFHVKKLRSQFYKCYQINHLAQMDLILDSIISTTFMEMCLWLDANNPSQFQHMLC